MSSETRTTRREAIYRDLACRILADWGSAEPDALRREMRLTLLTLNHTTLKAVLDDMERTGEIQRDGPLWVRGVRR